MKLENMQLTYKQAKELQFFCRNVAGVRSDMYKEMSKVHKFDERIARLERTCELIEKFLGEKNTPLPEDWNEIPDEPA